KEVTMNILQDQRQRAFAPISLARLTHGAGRGIGPERLVVGAAIVVAGEPKQPRRPEDEQRRRERHPARPPRRFRPKQTVRRGAEEFRRVKRRDVGTERVVLALQSRPRGIDDERAQAEENEQRRRPPRITPHGLAKGTLL